MIPPLISHSQVASTLYLAFHETPGVNADPGLIPSAVGAVAWRLDSASPSALLQVRLLSSYDSPLEC